MTTAVKRRCSLCPGRVVDDKHWIFYYSYCRTFKVGTYFCSYAESTWTSPEINFLPVYLRIPLKKAFPFLKAFLTKNGCLNQPTTDSKTLCKQLPLRKVYQYSMISNIVLFIKGIQVIKTFSQVFIKNIAWIEKAPNFCHTHRHAICGLKYLCV